MNLVVKFMARLVVANIRKREIQCYVAPGWEWGLGGNGHMYMYG